MGDPATQISVYLDHHADEILSQWHEKTMIASNDTYKDYVLENGRSMFNLVLQYITEQTTLDHIKRLAEKVASQRVKANVNIGEFIYNVSQGRSMILNNLPLMDTAFPGLKTSIEKINECFDTFLYHAVTKYTELKNNVLEEKTLFIEHTHKERLTILGQMSSSFVHEFRNPLTSIMGFLKLLQNRYPNIEYLDIMSHELEQLNFRISQFLLVSKKEVSEEARTSFNLKVLIDETMEFLYPSIVDGEVDALTELDSTLTVFASRNQIRQIIINLIINSIDALQHMTEKRKLVVRAFQESDSWVQVSISNNGPEIPSELKETIFEPFVTTKDLGTGLGLYVCKQIMEKHLGFIQCHSDELQTTFSIHFPIHKQVLDPAGDKSFPNRTV